MEKEHRTRLGAISKLQIQLERLVRGVRPDRIYTPEPLVEVDAMVLSPYGAVAKIDGAWVLSVHHAAHPANSRPNPDRMLSIGFTSHYDLMRARFGDAPPGIGGEYIIVETDTVVTEEDLAGGVAIGRPDGRDVKLKGAKVAKPCVPFTRFLMGDSRADLDSVRPHREFLDNGMRGFVMGTAGLDAAVEISVGDPVYLAG